MVKLSVVPLPMSERSKIARRSTWLVGAAGIFLTALGAAALLQMRPDSQTDVAVLGFRLDAPHSWFLLVTGVLTLVSLARPLWMIAMTGVQALAYPVMLHVSSETSSNTFPEAKAHLWDLILYGVLFALCLALWFALVVDAYRQRRPEVSKKGWHLWWPD
jgi:hypothetical protein